MIRHVVMFKVKSEGNREANLENVKQTVDTLGRIPGIKNLTFGLTAGITNEPAYDAVLFIDFADEASYKAYLDHPIHKAAGQVTQICSEILAVDCVY